MKSFPTAPSAVQVLETGRDTVKLTLLLRQQQEQSPRNVLLPLNTGIAEAPCDDNSFLRAQHGKRVYLRDPMETTEDSDSDAGLGDDGGHRSLPKMHRCVTGGKSKDIRPSAQHLTTSERGAKQAAFEN